MVIDKELVEDIMTTKRNNMFIDAEKEGYNIKPKRTLSEEHKKEIGLSMKGNTNARNGNVQKKARRKQEESKKKIWRGKAWLWVRKVV